METITLKIAGYICFLFNEEEPHTSNSGDVIRDKLLREDILVTKSQLEDILEDIYDINDSSTWIKETISKARTAY